MHIVHVSADFPDSIAARKTPVIARLIALAPPPLRHTVYSLNRVSPSVPALARALGRPELKVETVAEPFGHALRYTAPGKGWFHQGALLQLGDWLAASIATAGPPPDLLVGHKLTVEGIAVHQAAVRLGVPYAITIQGNTDLKILRYRPDLREPISTVFHGAAQVFSFAPWSLAEVEGLLGKRAGASENLPCPPDFDEIIAPDQGGRGLLSVFHLHNSKGKNLARMVAALRRIEGDYPDARLQIAGTGTPDDVRRCEAIIAGHRAIALTGEMSRATLRQTMNRAAGFVLPSLRESFGLVFAEALLSGLPIAYPKGAAVDGYFDGCPFAIPVDARSTGEIAQAMAALLQHSAQLKAELAQWQATAAARRFLPEAIGASFHAGLTHAARADQ